MSVLQQGVLNGELIFDRDWDSSVVRFDEIEHMRQAYSVGYERGWLSGFVIGLIFVGASALCALVVLLN